MRRDREHTRDGQARDQDRQALREAGRERVAPAEADELVAPRPDACERVGLAPVDDELRRAAQQPRRARPSAPRGRRPGARPAARVSRERQRGHEHADEHEPDGEDGRGRGQERTP